MKKSVLKVHCALDILTPTNHVGLKNTQSSWITYKFKLSHILGVTVGRPCDRERGEDLVR